MARSIQQALQEAKQELHDYVDDSYTDSHVLMSHCLRKNRAWLLAHGNEALEKVTDDAFRQLIDARRCGVPVAHLTGTREFWSMSFRVTPDTLIPRPETEHLIEQVLTLPLPGSGVNVLDFGTGSGVIAVVLAKERPHWQMTAIDCSAIALHTARQNATTHNVAINFIEGCSLESFVPQTFDLIVSNPPYIAADDPHLQQGDVRFEPSMALASGSEGLDCIRDLVTDAPRYLRPSRYLVMEHGYDQGEVIRALLGQHGYIEINTHKDLSGHERITSARWTG